MNRKVASLLMLALMVSPSLAMFVWATPLTVDIDGEDFAPGEDVEIYGATDPNANVTILVSGTLGIIYNITISADEDGDYETTVQLPNDVPEGTYNVTVSVGEETARASFTVTVTYTSEEEETVEETAEKAVGLKVAIERAYVFLDRINATAERLRNEGYDVNQIKAYLEKANETLIEANSLLDSFYIDEAARELAKARGILGRTMGLLHSTAKKIKTVKAVRFLERMEKRVLSTNQRISRLKGSITARAIASATAALQNTKMKLQRIRAHLEAGDMAEAIDELDDAVEEIDESIDELNGQGVSTLMREMDRLEAKIRVLNATAERLGERGEDTSAIEEAIQKAQDLLNEAMELIEEGNTDAADELLEEIREHLEKTLEVKSKMIRSKAVNAIKKWIKVVKKLHRKKDED